jgi:mannose-6-phosphate isomerase-like protein (cupin superfamily)
VEWLLIEVWKVPGVKVPLPNERVLKVLMSPEVTDTEKLTLLVSLISPHSSTGPHIHDVDEFMYIVTGRGESYCGGERSDIESDVLFYAPAKVQHEVRNTGEETMKLFCIFSPPMRPQGFFEEATKLAKERLNPSKS